VKAKELIGEALDALERLERAALALPTDAEYRKLLTVACLDVKRPLLKALAA
jgi:hypothetical protein